ncbi:recombinase family protein [Pseudoalteromonas sp. Ps84H-4]|uniref:recombinase family protein n=1 Tax=Pseudoalteromonas sp. Ps84H-4 TaxID=2954502 RepID=UPI00209827D5|nr:recombinase family protein [Pseudoalteromonas sp. Ps84H-4]MCO7251666.1 recombinase family protein [Pseudoalteromonas sp. Ps84H-4]
MTDYIYSRVSTKEQNSASQAKELLQTYSDAIVYEEKQSGKNMVDRPVFQELLSVVKAGDRIIVRELSRIGRNTKEVITLFEELEAKGVAVIIKELQVDSTSATGKMVLTIMASVSQMEREIMLERQKAGIEEAKAAGKFKGKQQSPKTIKACKEALQYVQSGLSKEKAAKAAGIGVATLYRYIKDTKKNS